MCFSRSALLGSKAKSFDGLTALWGRTGEPRYTLAKEEVIEKDSDAEDEKKKTEEQEFVELKSFEVPYRRLRRPQSVV